MSTTASPSIDAPASSANDEAPSSVAAATNVAGPAAETVIPAAQTAAPAPSVAAPESTQNLAPNAAPKKAKRRRNLHLFAIPKSGPSSIRWTYLISIVGVHLLALLAFFPWYFSWSAIVMTLVGIHVFGQGINLGYHRLLTHRSLQLPKWLERTYVILALCCLEDTPAKWVAIHRIHHSESDDEGDPHSPHGEKFSWIKLFWSHAGWLFVHNVHTHSLSAYMTHSMDVLEDPFYRRLEKRVDWLGIYLAHLGVIFLAGALFGYAWEGTSAAAWQLGSSWFIWAGILRTVIVWHITWSVNSLTHVTGYRNYETRDNSRNNWFVALVTVGEGWHNNHHHDPSSASNQHKWYELDPTWWEIMLLERLGLAKRVNRPRAVRQALRKQTAQQSTSTTDE